MLAGRLLQGFGAAGPRTVIIALVRDRYAGRGMARIMSFVMAVFILVPVIAPAIGQGIVFVSHWRAIFGLFLVLALIGLAWFAVRQPETLPAERRVRFSPRQCCRRRRGDLHQPDLVGLHDRRRADLRRLRRLPVVGATDPARAVPPGRPVPVLFRRPGGGDRRRFDRERAPRHVLRHAGAVEAVRSPRCAPVPACFSRSRSQRPASRHCGR